MPAGPAWSRVCVWTNTHAHKNADSKKKSFHSLALLKNTATFQQQTFPPQPLQPEEFLSPPQKLLIKAGLVLVPRY